MTKHYLLNTSIIKKPDGAYLQPRWRGYNPAARSVLIKERT